MLYTFFFISPRFTPQKITSNISCSLVIFVTKKKAQPKITITHLHFTPHSPSPASHPEVDFSSGWIYCMKDSAGPWPAEGRWSSEGTSDPNGAPWCGKSPTFEQDSHGLDWWLDIIFTYHKLNTYGKNPTIYIYIHHIYIYIGIIYIYIPCLFPMDPYPSWECLTVDILHTEPSGFLETMKRPGWKTSKSRPDWWVSWHLKRLVKAQWKPDHVHQIYIHI